MVIIITKPRIKTILEMDPLIQRCSNCGSNRIITDIESGEILIGATAVR